MQKPIGAVVVLLAALLVGPFVAGEGVAHATDARTEKAREHYLQADAFYKLDKYANALAEYEQAYIAKPDPSFLYNIAQCHRLMGNRAEGVKFYRRYLKDAPHAPNREVAEKHIKDLEASLAALPEEASTARPGTPTSLPSTTPAPMPAPAPTPLAPLGGPSNAQPAGRTLALNAPPPASPDASIANGVGNGPPSSGDDKPIYTKWWFWTGVGAVVVGGLVVLLASGGDPSCPAGRTCR